MNVRLIASDLDGTLFGADHVPEARTVAAVNAAADAGIVVAAVTGRSFHTGPTIATSTGARLDWFIGANGGHRLHMARNELEERLVFDPAQITRVIDGLADSFDDLAMIFEQHHGHWQNDAALEHFPVTLDGKPRVNTGEYRADDVGKVLLMRPGVAPVDLMRDVVPHVPDSLHLTSSGINFVEITPEGADKGSALARLCGLLGIERHEVIAFGDNHNDLTMLEWAGRGVAMGNAEPEVKAIADEVTETNARFGVARVIEELLA